MFLLNKNEFRVLFIVICLTINFHCCMTTASKSEGNEKCAGRSYQEAHCLSPICIQEAAKIIGNMNQNINPCDNFYQFVCGNFSKTHTIPNDLSRFGFSDMALQEFRNQLIPLLKSEIKTNDLNAVKNLKNFYRNCMNTPRIEEEDLQPMMELLDKLGGWPVQMGELWNEDNYQWNQTLSKILAVGLEPYFPIYLQVDEDPNDTKKNIIMLISNPTLVDETYFLEDSSKRMDALKSYMVDIAEMLGASRDIAYRDMEDCLNFEIKIHKSKIQVGRANRPSPIEYRMSLKKLTKRYGNISWLRMINKILNSSGITVDGNETVQISYPDYITEIGDLINNTSKRVLANYQIWQQIMQLIEYLPARFQRRQLNFYNELGGIYKRNRRETECTDKALQLLQVAVSAAYVRDHFDEDIKQSVSSMVKNIKAQLKSNLEKIEWMDNITQGLAVKKLGALRTIVAYPNELLDDEKVDEFYKNLEITNGSLMNNYINITAFKKNLSYKKLRNPIKGWISDAGVATIDPIYVENKNELHLPAALLGNSYYKSKRPAYLNYAVLGALIGHDITHALDMVGRLYDKNGNDKDWWQNETVNNFNEKLDCFGEQYDNYTNSQVDPNVYGRFSVVENTAHNSGIKLAYEAYKKLKTDNKIREKRLPGLHYTPEQLFWISAATVDCAKSTDQDLQNNISNDRRGEVRVNVVFSNSEYFAKDFHCDAGSMMNPENKCALW